MSWTRRWAKRLRALLRKEAVERELDEELAFHLEMETDRLVREKGLDRAEARRQAAILFGGVEKAKEEVRDARTLGWTTGMSLDLRLGARMLVKYPGLALVGGLGMAVAIAVGALFEVAAAVVRTPLPFDEGERVVALEVWDTEINNQDRQILHDFAAWRRELRSVRELGAYRTLERNLIVPRRAPEPVAVAEITASAFGLARVPPLLGRYLVEADEREGAPPVVVIAHDVWRTRFDADPGVVGRDVRLGGTVHTVVGVMPEGFAFPLDHRFWVPLRADRQAFGPRDGPGIYAFGRLAPGATLPQAQAELAAAGRRMAAAHPQTHARLQPRVVPYTLQIFDDGEAGLVYVVRAMLTLLLVVVCVNVAILVYARTATRRAEITVRSALGASRRRIVAQLFAEALVLSAGAAAVGLAVAALALGRTDALLEPMRAEAGGIPFWMEFRLSAANVLYVVGLTVLGAVIVGVVPALKATGARLDSSLRQLGGAGGMRMGRTWGALIVAQVAFAVALMPAAIHFAGDWIRYGTADPGFAAGEYLSAWVGMDRETPPAPQAEAYEREYAARYAARQAALARRLEADPALSAVTFATELPGREPTMRVAVDGVPTPPKSSGHLIRTTRVDAAFFDAFDVPLLAGRRLLAADAGTGAMPVVVNRTFVREVLGGADALGRRIRYAEGYRSGGVSRLPEGVTADDAFEIVGVVGDLPAKAMEPGSSEARVYHPLVAGEQYPLYLLARVRGGAAPAAAGRLREATAALDPTLRLNDLRPLDAVLAQWQGGMRTAALAVTAVTLSVLLLSAAGLYALMSFAVVQRRREIGIRAALGADPRRILASVFSRVMGQLALGVVVGLAVAGLLEVAMGGEMLGGQFILLPLVAVLMMGVGLLAAAGPARRGLAIQPMEALRTE